MTEQTTETPPVPDVSEGRRLLAATETPEGTCRHGLTESHPINHPDPKQAWCAGPLIDPLSHSALAYWLRNNAAALLDAVEAVQRVRDWGETLWDGEGSPPELYESFFAALDGSR